MYICPKCENEVIVRKQDIYGKGVIFKAFCSKLGDIPGGCNWKAESTELSKFDNFKKE